VVADRETGDKLAADLEPGQVLVTRDGQSWRWDGYVCRKLHAADAAAKLEQRNRLKALEKEFAGVQSKAEQARTRMQAAEAMLNTARDDERQARQRVREAFSATGAARAELTRITQSQSKAASEAAGLKERLASQSRDLETVPAQRAEAEAELKAMPSLDEAIQVLDDFRHQLETARQTANDKHQLVDRIRREVFGRRKRLEAIEGDERSWNERMSGSDDHSRDLATRAEALEAELASLKDQPAALAEKEQGLLDALAEAEREAKRQADALIEQMVRRSNVLPFSSAKTG